MSAPALFQAQSVDEAIAQAQAQGKLVLIDFTADWCAPCKQMDATTWRAPEVERWVAEHALAVQIDVDRQKDVSKRFTVQAMPTMVLLRDGKELDRSTGGRNAAKLLHWLENARQGRTEVETMMAELPADDPSARLHLARVLQMRGKPEEALAQLEWCWFHGVEHQPGWVGVKHSFLAGQLAQLAQQSPPARSRIAGWRDALEPRLSEREPFAEWCTLNRVLDEEDRTLAWFDGVKAAPPPRLKLAEDHTVLELLKSRQRGEDFGRLIADPVGRLAKTAAVFAESARHLPPGAPAELVEELRAHGARALREEASSLARAMRAAGRRPDAEAVAAKALELDGSEEMKAALAGQPQHGAS